MTEWSKIKKQEYARINETINEFHTRVVNEIRMYASNIKIVEALFKDNYVRILYREKIKQPSVVIHGNATNNTIITGSNNFVSEF